MTDPFVIDAVWPGRPRGAAWDACGVKPALFSARAEGVEPGLSERHGRKCSGRRPDASVNVVAAHDGRMRRDLVCCNDQHHEVNTEDNRNGHGHKLSWNRGADGASHYPWRACSMAVLTPPCAVVACADAMPRAEPGQAA